MRIVADTTKCVGAGQCVLTDPSVFDQSEDDGTVIVLVERPTDLDKAKEAVGICPSGALSLADD
jgi:ferredoxin